MGEILKKKISQQREPHTAKLYFFVFLNFFWKIHGEDHFFVQKETISEKSTGTLRKLGFFFLV